MNVPKDPFRLSARTVFLWGSGVVVLLTALVFLYVPPAPKTRGIPKSYQDYGMEQPGTDQRGAAEDSGTEGESIQSVTTVEQRYQTFCSQCHGKKGDGDAPLARMMSTKPPSLIAGPFRFARTPEAIAALIRNGAGAMPGFKDEISEAQALELATHVLAFSGQDGSGGAAEGEASAAETDAPSADEENPIENQEAQP